MRLTPDLNQRCKELLFDLQLLDPADTIDVSPLPGGVSSDIALVTTADKQWCVKFALAKLKVEADWFAPVHRNSAEYAWLEVAASVAPEGAITLFGQSESLQGFAMEYVTGEDTYLWKASLLAEEPDRGEAQRVGELLARIHAASAQPEFDTRPFRNQQDFHALRLEPYLLFTASRHENVAERLRQLASNLRQSSSVLIHGDVSPKNILIRKEVPVILDAECATMGDASFDVAFCLNHLVLKAMHLPLSRQRYLSNALELWQAYNAYVDWESADELEARICLLLPALMLGRIDGKSPVEYLTVIQQQAVRCIALHLLESPFSNLQDLIMNIQVLSGVESA